MEILDQTVYIMTLTCMSWSEGQHDLYFTVQWFCLISWRLFDGWISNFWMGQCYITFDLKLNVGHSNLDSTVQWFLPNILKTIWWMNVILSNNESFDLKINIGQYDLYFTVQCFCLISWRLFNGWTSYFWDNESVWHKLWVNNKCRSQWPIFHGPVILPYILKTIWLLNVFR